MLRTGLLCWIVLLTTTAAAQGPGPAAAAPGAGKEASGRDILQRRCFQCHSATMWTSLRQDRRGWEAVLYRMVGRGALWTEAEISAMADALAEMRGPMP